MRSRSTRSGNLVRRGASVAGIHCERAATHFEQGNLRSHLTLRCWHKTHAKTRRGFCWISSDIVSSFVSRSCEIVLEYEVEAGTRSTQLGTLKRPNPMRTCLCSEPYPTLWLTTFQLPLLFQGKGLFPIVYGLVVVPWKIHVSIYCVFLL